MVYCSEFQGQPWFRRRRFCLNKKLYTYSFLLIYFKIFITHINFFYMSSTKKKSERRFLGYFNRAYLNWPGNKFLWSCKNKVDPRLRLFIGEIKITLTFRILIGVEGSHVMYPKSCVYISIYLRFEMPQHNKGKCSHGLFNKQFIIKYFLTNYISYNHLVEAWPPPPNP